MNKPKLSTSLVKHLRFKGSTSQAARMTGHVLHMEENTAIKYLYPRAMNGWVFFVSLKGIANKLKKKN